MIHKYENLKAAARHLGKNVTEKEIKEAIDSAMQNHDAEYVMAAGSTAGERYTIGAQASEIPGMWLLWLYSENCGHRYGPFKNDISEDTLNMIIDVIEGTGK